MPNGIVTFLFGVVIGRRRSEASRGGVPKPGLRNQGREVKSLIHESE
jgi:hypothetical protein